MPMFEWMLTDNCGSINTGWFNPGKSMDPVIDVDGNSWDAVFNISVGSTFGNAIWYPNEPNYFSQASGVNFTLDMSKSLTLFAYYHLYALTGQFCFIEFNEYSSIDGEKGPHFWYDGGGLYINFSE